MQKHAKSNIRIFFIFVFSALLLFSLSPISAQEGGDDGEGDDYGEYDDEYDDSEYDDEYDDSEYDDEYDDSEYDDEYDDSEYDDEYDDSEYDDEYDDSEYDDEYDDSEYDDEYDEYDEYDDYGDYGEYDDYGDYGDYDDVDYYDTYEEFEETAADENVDATYDISEEKDLEGEPSDAQQQLWDAFTKIVPAEYLDNFSKLEVFTDPETSGYVYQDENDPTKFVLGLNSDELSNPAELNHTIIHEFAHVLTLNTTQFDGTLASGGGGTCSTLSLDEGCTNEGSYINQFNTQFWTDGSASGEGQFVTEYAGTNVAEDMAESFTAFVLQDQPTGDSVADQKISFFYQFPELVNLRDQIRSNMASSS